jgi:HEPN domain-containing protein
MPSLNEHLEWWTKQAAHDLEMAKSNRQNGFHDGCAVMCQQSAEKYLKSLYMKVHVQTPPRTHRCDQLAAMLGAPKNVITAAAMLESDYLKARYPDVAQGVPFEFFNDARSQERTEAAEEVQQWVLQQLTPKS